MNILYLHCPLEGNKKKIIALIQKTYPESKIIAGNYSSDTYEDLKIFKYLVRKHRINLIIAYGIGCEYAILIPGIAKVLFNPYPDEPSKISQILDRCYGKSRLIHIEERYWNLRYTFRELQSLKKEHLKNFKVDNLRIRIVIHGCRKRLKKYLKVMNKKFIQVTQYHGTDKFNSTNWEQHILPAVNDLNSRGYVQSPCWEVLKPNIVIYAGFGIMENTYREDPPTLWYISWKEGHQAKFEYLERNKLDSVMHTQPSKIHKYIASLQQWFKVTVITETLDDFFERVGIHEVYHVAYPLSYLKDYSDQYLCPVPFQSLSLRFIIITKNSQSGIDKKR